jgi:hypothetical protein
MSGMSSSGVVRLNHLIESALGVEKNWRSMIRTLVLIPERDNEGLAYPPNLAREWETKLLERFGGWSRRRGVEGAWRSHLTGRTHYDTSTEYVVALDGWRCESG